MHECIQEHILTHTPPLCLYFITIVFRFLTVTTTTTSHNCRNKYRTVFIVEYRTVFIVEYRAVFIVEFV